MQLGINGKLDVRARLPLATLQLAHDAAGRVHLDLTVARDATQQIFLSRFHVDFADLEAGNP